MGIGIKRIGYFKWRGDRVVSNLQRIVSLITLTGVMTVAQWSLWWLCLLPIGLLGMWWVDKWWIYPGESESSFNENPAFKALRNDVREILKRLDGIERRMR